jgi:hypothetical protein
LALALTGLRQANNVAFEDFLYPNFCNCDKAEYDFLGAQAWDPNQQPLFTGGIMP